ncbi:MAG: RNA 3'-terminal phosphate cyclase [Nitrospirae bacterium]|nr:RNA 3'-terminal phosphate cyclase [Nitrospirota bacterium]
MNNYITIDGSYGEGGGQILRTALSLSLILSKPIEIINIRKGRKKGGLQPQHLTCVNACKDVSDATVEGNEIGSTLLHFSPQRIKSGNFTFDVAEKRGSAGSTSLVIQTLLPPLCIAQRPVRLTVMGGTHVPWSPPFHYLKEVFLSVIARMGASVELSIDKWGWYPIGGGIIHAEINPLVPIPLPLQITPPTFFLPPLWGEDMEGGGERRGRPVLREVEGVRGPGLRGIRIEARGKLQRIKGISAVSNLPLSIAERQKKEGLNNLKTLGVDTDIEVSSAPSLGKGAFFFIVAEYEKIMAGFSSLGAIGKPAEEVAREACRDFLEYHEAHGAVDPHLADQLIPYIALAEGVSSFTTTKITRHLLTNVWTVRQFMDVDIRVEGIEGDEGMVVKM